jgi:hypothetical protein
MTKNFIDQILKARMHTKLFFLYLILLFTTSCNDLKNDEIPFPSTIQFVYTSDAHFGIKRATFQGGTNVDASVVNAKMIEKINTLSTLVLPVDNGVNAGKVIGGIDYFINTGDMANREETGIQSSTASWTQFTSTYINGLTLKNSSNQNTPILLLPGNHDVTNAIGFYKTMAPLTDNGSMVGIYNYMFPAASKTVATYNYSTDKIHYSKDVYGVHMVFVNMWPDETERTWIESDLKTVSSTTPVILFTHDQPTVESKHFSNPNGVHDINATDKFENLIPEVFKDGLKITDPSTLEQKSFVAFLKLHPNIKAYFHGNDNENKFYDYKGPDNDITLKTFQVDSPMKGNFSATDETKLSFQLISIDTKAKTLTARECLWNLTPTNPSAAIAWGANVTISLQ